MRKTLVAANWKMNKTVKEAVSFVKALKPLVSSINDKDVLICPPFTALYALSKELEGSNILLGAQNMFYEEKGAFTGEISPLMLKELGCSYVILGHSERRRIFKETDELINKKVKSAVLHGFMPIVCIGESLDERESGRTFDIIERQLRLDLKDVKGDIVVAYEPLWAIGTGETATPEIAESVHKFIRSVLVDIYDSDAESIRLIYGGSVKPNNVEKLVSMNDIDGVLVGGASLNVDSFYRIIELS